MNSPIKDTILQMATERGTNKTICPSEVARVMFGNAWRNHMSEVRTEAIDLYKARDIVITQKGEPVDPDNFKGPVRIRIKS